MNEMDLRALARTNEDATARKIHAVKRGYWRDDFIGLLAGACTDSIPIQNSPVMNRGFWLRVDLFSSAVRQFIAQVGGSGVHQVVCLGAGYDTTFYRLNSEGVTTPHTVWVDVDLPDVIAVKEKVFSELSSQPIQGLLHRLSHDLRDAEGLFQKLQGILCRDTPTLFLCECVLVYLDPWDSDAIIAAAVKSFPKVAFLTYDAVQGNDAFGSRMVESLRSRGCTLRGIDKYNTAESYAERFLRLGYTFSRALDMASYATRTWRLRPEALQHVKALERLDEIEEWDIIHKHYSVAFGTTWGPDAFSWLHGVIQ